MEDPIINLENYTVTLEETQANKPILENLKLLGWEDSQLMDELLSPDMNQAKMFYKYLTENKLNPKKSRSLIESPKNSPVSVTPDSKTRRRASDTRARSQGASSKRRTSRSRSRSREKSKDTSTEESTSENKENVESSSLDKSSSSDKKTTSAKKIKTQPPVLRTPASSDDTNVPPTTATTNQTTFSRTRTPRQRAATVGDGTRPQLNSSDTKSRWGVSPSQDPSAKFFSVESKMSISQILDNLKVCFGGLELEFSEKKQKNLVKVKGRLSAGNRKKTQVIVEVKPLDDGNVQVHFKPKSASKKTTTTLKKKESKKKDNFPEVCKKIEETLIV